MSYGFSYSMARRIEERHKAEPNNLLFSTMALCLKKNIVPSQIADHLGVSKQHVYNWINGKYAVSDEDAAALKQFQKDLKANRI